MLEMLGELEEKAQSEQLKEQFRHHAEETRLQIRNLDQVFSAIGVDPAEQPCPAIDGIHKEGRKTIQQVDDGIVDAVILAGAAETEHHEIAVYEGLITHAGALGHEDVSRCSRKTSRSSSTRSKRSRRPPSRSRSRSAAPSPDAEASLVSPRARGALRRSVFRAPGSISQDPGAEDFLGGLNEYLRPRELQLYRDREIEHAFVFVVGLPRSGTTLLTQVLASASTRATSTTSRHGSGSRPCTAYASHASSPATPSPSPSSPTTPAPGRSSTSTSSATSGGTGSTSTRSRTSSTPTSGRARSTGPGCGWPWPTSSTSSASRSWRRTCSARTT